MALVAACDAWPTSWGLLKDPVAVSFTALKPAFSRAMMVGQITHNGRSC